MAWGKENLNHWSAWVILRWRRVPGRLYCYVCCLFPVGNFKQKFSEALSHICLSPAFLQIITCGSWIIHLYMADWILWGCLTPRCFLPKEGVSFKIIHQIQSQKTNWAQPLKKNQDKERVYWFLALSTPFKPTPCILQHNNLIVKDAN